MCRLRTTTIEYAMDDEDFHGMRVYGIQQDSTGNITVSTDAGKFYWWPMRENWDFRGHSSINARPIKDADVLESLEKLRKAIPPFPHAQKELAIGA